MKNSTLALMTLFLQEKKVTAQDVATLFDIYTTNEISSMEDFKTIKQEEFFNFVKDNLYRFPADDVGKATRFARFRTNAIRHVSNGSFHFHRNDQESFAKEVGLIVEENKDKKILEVGSGVIPLSSMILGVDGYDISSIDEFYLSEDCLRKFNVKSFRQLFNESHNVKDYDIVVGRKPCSAIVPIIEKCTADNVPYFIRLCGCELPSKSVYDWRPILRKIDENIKYEGAYAYNLQGEFDDSQRTMKNIIDLDHDKIMM